MTHLAPIPELYVSPDAATALLAEAEKLPAWTLDARQAGDLAMLMSGAFVPLRGYMSEADWRAVKGGETMPWPVPMALQVDADLAGRVQPGDDIALRGDAGVLAILSVTDAWGEPTMLGGKVKGLRRPVEGMTPNAVRALLRDRGTDRVLAIQPTDPDQIAPAARLAHQMDAALLIQPFPGIAVEAPAGAVLAPLTSGPPAGPHAALWQGLVARNYGATHIVPGNDGAAREVYRQHQDRIGVRMVDPDGSR